MESDIGLALRAALTGASVAMRYYASIAGLSVEEKSDGSVVTEADRAVEAAIRVTLRSARPNDAILGEEAGQTGSGSRRWIVDPIDGTSLFLSGDDRWLVLVALAVAGEIVAGVAVVPAQSRIWWASLGGGAHQASIVDGEVCDERTISVNLERPIDAEAALLGVVPLVGGLTPGELALIAPVQQWAADTAWNAHPALLVANGELDIALQTRGKIWDFAAPSLIVTEAGGNVTYLDGPTNPGLFTSDVQLREATLGVLKTGETGGD